MQSVIVFPLSGYLVFVVTVLSQPPTFGLVPVQLHAMIPAGPALAQGHFLMQPLLHLQKASLASTGLLFLCIITGCNVPFLSACLPNSSSWRRTGLHSPARLYELNWQRLLSTCWWNASSVGGKDRKSRLVEANNVHVAGQGRCSQVYHTSYRRNPLLHQSQWCSQANQYVRN